MSEIDTLRATALADSEAFNNRPRFGLFSQPISTAIGDDGPYKSSRHPRTEAGKPITSARGIYANPPCSGSLNKSYFGPINSLAASGIADQYVDPQRRLLQQANALFNNGLAKEAPFKPSCVSKALHRSAYIYEDEKVPDRNPKRNRDGDGKVRVNPRNVFTNSQSKVISTLFKDPQHLVDEYERASKLEQEAHKKAKAKQPEAPFKPSGGTIQLSTVRDIYFNDSSLKATVFPEPKLNIFPHENKWKCNSPAKQGIVYGAFEPFPAYKENPPRQAVRLPKSTKQVDPFRRQSISHSRPSPSISLNPTNLLKTISHSVSHSRRH